MFGFGKKDISEKKLRKWQTEFRVEKIVDALHNGSETTQLAAIAVLTEINMTKVKQELLKCLEDKSAPVAAKAAEALEYMGITPDERKLMTKYKKGLNTK